MRNRREQMTKQERTRGWIFFALYILVLPILVGLVRFVMESVWAFSLSDVSANFIYHVALTAAICILFSSYLANAWNILQDFLPENLIALGIGFFGYLLLKFLVGVLPLPMVDTLPMDYAQEYLYAPQLTVMVFIFLMPIAEELLFRGLLFGTMKQSSRPLAYTVNILIFCLSAVWPLAITAGDVRYIWNALEYLPAALALCWCYDKGGSIFSPIVLRWMIHAIVLLQGLRMLG